MYFGEHWLNTGVRRGLWRLVLTAALCIGVAGCTAKTKSTANLEPGLQFDTGPRSAATDQAVSRGGGRTLIGKSYRIAGKWFSPKEEPGYDRTGTASWYGAAFQGRRTANGEIFDRTALSAAHPTLPLPSYVRVTNLENARSVVVRVNDRGPFAHKRLIDVSERTADLLQFKRDGMAKVRVEYVDEARIDGQDEDYLIASFHAPAAGGADVRVAATSTTPGDQAKAAVPIVIASREMRGDAATQPTVSFTRAEPDRSLAHPAIAEAVEVLTVSREADARISTAFQSAAGIPE